MTALAVIGLIALFLAILLFSPVRLHFEYRQGKIRASVNYLFIRIDFSPEKVAKRAEKKAEREIKKEYKKQKEEEGTKQKEKKAAEDTIKTVWSLLKSCKKGLNTLRRHIILYKIRLDAVIGGDEAQKIATGYAYTCMLVSNLIAVLDKLFAVRKTKINIQPGFGLDKTIIAAAFRIRVAPVYVIAAGLQILVRYIKAMNKNKRKRKKIKGGKQHEPTTSCQ